MTTHIVIALGRALVVVERNKGEITSMKANPLCMSPALISGTSCFLSPEKLRATKLAPSCSARPTRSIDSYRLGLPFLLVEPLSLVAENWPLVSP